MSDMTADLIDFLKADSSVGLFVEDRIYGGTVPPGSALPFVWLQRDRTVEGGELDDEDLLPLSEIFRLEVVDDSAENATAAADAVRDALKATQAMGGTTYSGIDVREQGEDYVPRNVDAGEDLFISSLEIEVYRP